MNGEPDADLSARSRPPTKRRHTAWSSKGVGMATQFSPLPLSVEAALRPRPHRVSKSSISMSELRRTRTILDEFGRTCVGCMKRRRGEPFGLNWPSRASSAPRRRRALSTRAIQNERIALPEFALTKTRRAPPPSTYIPILQKTGRRSRVTTAPPSTPCPRFQDRASARS